MSSIEDYGVALPAVLEKLREDLNVLRYKAEDERLQFTVESVEIELKVAVKREAKGSAKAKLYVVEFGAEGSSATETTQVIRLKLKPMVVEPGEAPTETKISRPRMPEE